MATPDPLKGMGGRAAASEKRFVIAGIETIVYGLDELRQEVGSVACLWLLHPRLSDQSRMAPMASAAISHWNSLLGQRQTIKPSTPGLIAVSFDQRNHGSRLVQRSANDSWRDGNARHAQDMFSIYQGTASDTSQLITYLSGYIFPQNERSIVGHMAMGVSLGGHSAWHCLLHEPRISSGVVVIGCPDYFNLMRDRARLSKRESWTQSEPAGCSFVGSKDFPDALVTAVETYDPAGLLLGSIRSRTAASYNVEPDAEERKRLVAIMNRTLRGKRILNLSGGADKLVPYAQGEPFLRWLKSAIGPTGWYADGGVVLKDSIFDGVGHVMSPAMLDEAVRFIAESLQQMESTQSPKI